MVYDRTDISVEVTSHEPGYSIYDYPAGVELYGDEHRYSIYTDDGRGNGDYVCGTSDLFYAKRIALALDLLDSDPHCEC